MYLGSKGLTAVWYKSFWMRVHELQEEIESRINLRSGKNDLLCCNGKLLAPGTGEIESYVLQLLMLSQLEINQTQQNRVLLFRARVPPGVTTRDLPAPCKPLSEGTSSWTLLEEESNHKSNCEHQKDRYIGNSSTRENWNSTCNSEYRRVQSIIKSWLQHRVNGIQVNGLLFGQHFMIRN